MDSYTYVSTVYRDVSSEGRVLHNSGTGAAFFVKLWNGDCLCSCIKNRTNIVILNIINSASFLAELSVGSPRKLFIFNIYKNIL